MLMRARRRIEERFPRNRAWLQRFTPSADGLRAMQTAAAELPYRPFFSVVMPVYNPPSRFLREAVESVCAQVYPYWELCIADDASTDGQVRELLAECAAREPRIKVVYRETNGHISAASNSALDRAQGEFIAFMDHDDTLAPHALFEVARALNADRDLDLLYSDEDKIDERGRRCEPTFKGGWAPDYFLSFMYLGHLAVYRRRLVDEAGRFRLGYEGSQDYDLALRVTERTQRVGHIPQILYHWRRHPDSVAANINVKPYAFTVARRALADALARRGCPGARVEETRLPGIYQAAFPASAAATAACLVLNTAHDASGGDTRMLQADAGYPIAEFAVSTREDSRHPVRFWRAAIENSSAEYVVLLQRGLVPGRGWLTRFLELFALPGAGVVGAKLVSPAGRIVHAGYTIAGTRVTNNFYGARRIDSGYAARLVTLQNVSAVSSCCLAVRRDVILESGVLACGYQSAAAAEIDLCLSAARAGRRVICSPFVEAVMPGPLPPRRLELQDLGSDCALLEERHRISSFVDPFYPRALDARAADFAKLGGAA